jgi:hypothetical protein
MAHVCRTCSRVNPLEALFCYYDGVALDRHHLGGPIAVGAKPFPTPFVFPSGRECHNFDDLARACDADWNGARELLQQGYLESFLGGLGRADLALAARQAAKESDPDRGLDQFLGKLPASGREGAKLVVQPLEINLGEVSGERRFVIRLDNQGGGILTGSVSGDETPWLAFGDAPGSPRKIFQCRNDHEIAVHVVSKNLRASNKPIDGRILIESNGGAALVMVHLEKPVQPFPEGVLAGAKLPREIAAKAKAHPKEAAALFEKGAIKAWYEANGWTYPVQGPSSSGLGAIQQFFEALGLVQPPHVTISQDKIQFHGKAGGFLEKVIHVQTTEKRPVYAHATTNASWLQVGRPLLEGRSASIPIRVPSIPPSPGERLNATVQVASNGNQRFTVEVELTVAGSPGDRQTANVPVLAPADAPLLAKAELMPVEIVGGRAFSSSRPPKSVPPNGSVVETFEPVLPVAASPAAFTPLAPAVVPAPRSPVSEAPAAVPMLPFIAPIVPILFLSFSLFVLLLHDLFVRSDANSQLAHGTSSEAPLIGLRFHDAAHPGRDINERQEDPTMRFGLLMRRQDRNGGFIDLTADDLNTLSKGGQPADLRRFKRLTFGEWGGSNNTCLKIDGQDYLFGDTTGMWMVRGEPIGSNQQGLRSVWRPLQVNVEVTQTVEIVIGAQSGRYDTCLIRYTIDNKDSRPHNVGIRFLLDTYIGDNDGVPFTIPGDAVLCDTMKLFEGSEHVPDYIQALEKPDLRHPGTVAQIQFRVSSKLESPTRVLLGGWPDPGLAVKEPNRYRDAKGGKTLWEVPAVSMQYLNQQPDVFVKDDRGNKVKAPKDSSVTLYWDPQNLETGKTREVGFTYGLGNVSNSEGEGRLLLTVGGRLVRDAEFTLTALVANPTPGETLTLTLPAGLNLVSGGGTQTVQPGAARDSSTVTWKLRAVRDGVYNLQVKSSNGQTQSQSVTIRSTGVFD